MRHLRVIWTGRQWTNVVVAVDPLSTGGLSYILQGWQLDSGIPRMFRTRFMLPSKLAGPTVVYQLTRHGLCKALQLMIVELNHEAFVRAWMR